MERRVIYILCFCVIVFITFELMMLSLVWGYEVVGNRIILMTLPGILIGFFAVLFTTRFLVPRFLLRGRLVLFGIFTFLTAYAVLLSFLEIENIGLRSIGVAPRIESWGSPVIFIERACDSVIMTIMLFALGAYSLYKEGDRVSKKEQESASLLNSYIANVKYRLDQNEINRRLDRIEDDLKKEVGSVEIEREIDNLSDYLRKQLYEMPVPPAVEIAVESRRSEKIGNFLTGKRWRWVRALLFQFVLVLMSLEALFPLPDKISMEPEGLAMCFAIYCLLNLLVLINKYWLRRRFRRHRSAKRYIVETVCVVTIPFFGFILYNLLTSTSPVAEVYHPFWIMVPSTLGAYSSLILLMGGVTTIFLLKNRIETQQRMDMLSAETARQEFLFLKKQINPHFLFNVLNNINILSYEERGEALNMLRELRRLVKYQFEESSDAFITIEKEQSFLYSYLSLEASRTDNLQFSIENDIADSKKEIPTLLLIPIIENAVKHSTHVREGRKIEIRIREEKGEFRFECENNYYAEKEKRDVGGIGIKNVERRLELLYGDRGRMRIYDNGSTYKVIMKIPATGESKSSSGIGRWGKKSK